MLPEELARHPGDKSRLPPRHITNSSTKPPQQVFNTPDMNSATNIDEELQQDIYHLFAEIEQESAKGLIADTPTIAPHFYNETLSLEQ